MNENKENSLTSNESSPPSSTPSAGLRFKKLDLHVHTPASKDFADKSVTAEQVADTAIKQGLDGIAITDHNNGDWVDQVKDAAKGKNIVVFPGVEITCQGGKGGIHIIALFDPTHDKRYIDGLLAELGLTPEQYGDLKAVVNKTPSEVAEIINKRGGLTVFAHINSSNGVFGEMQGEQRTQLIKNTNIHAAEATDFMDEDKKTKKQRAVDFLNGNDPVYQRKLAVYQASDNPGISGTHSLDGLNKRSSYFKLDQINLEGLKQCFADPDVRIKQDFELAVKHYPRIERVKIKGGFLDGLDTLFHEGLNSVLGAKGAGKSLLIEILRFVLDQPPSITDIHDDHESKIATKLGEYSEVEIWLKDAAGRTFHLRRQYRPAENNPYEPEVGYDVSQLFPVLFLSQNEIIRVAEDLNEQIGFIDKFFDFRMYQFEIKEIEGKLGVLDVEFAESIKAYREQSDVQKTVTTATEEIKKIDLMLKDPIFEEYAKAEKKKNAFEEQIHFMQEESQKIAEITREIQTNEAPNLPKEIEDDPALKRVQDASKEHQKTIIKHQDELAKKLEELKNKAASEYETWKPKFKECTEKYTNKVREAGGNVPALAQARAKKVLELEQLKKRLNLIQNKAKKLQEIATKRKELTDKFTNAYQRYSDERKKKCEKFEKDSKGRLKISISEGSNHQEFKNRLTALLKGSGTREVDIDLICKNVDTTTFVANVINYAISGKMEKIDEMQKATTMELKRLTGIVDFLLQKRSYETILALQYKATPKDQPEIAFDIGGSTFQPLSKISVGQKCTAMLIMALSEGEMPIVIDQPEDSLDLRSIWDDVCQKLRPGKEQRQFIFTTHNSSVAVASDTDNFMIMEGTATAGNVLYSGSMDHAKMSDEVMKYLEGGVETYRMKYVKYDAKRKL